jgi:protein-disulfide isomerase
MPSGKKARQQRQQAAVRTPPPVRSKGGGGLRGPRQASPRVLAIAGGLVLIIVVVIVLAVVLGRGGSGGTTNGQGDSETLNLASGTPSVGSSTSSVALQGAPDAAKLFGGIPQSQFVLGKPTAPVVLTEFIDLQCPVCKDFETTVFPTIVQKYVRTGKLRVKMEPWSILDRAGTGVVDSDRGQKATIAAAGQNKAFQFAEMLYYNQGVEDTNWMNDAMISQTAASIDGLKPAQLVSDANSAATKSLAQGVDSLANTLAAKNTTGGFGGQGFIGTPGLFLSKGNGKLVFYGTGLPNLANLEAAINALLK